MCLAVPGKLEKILSADEAIADLGGIQKNINISLIEDPQPGDWVSRFRRSMRRRPRPRSRFLLKLPSPAPVRLPQREPQHEVRH